MLPSLGEGIDEVEVSDVLVKPNDSLKIDLLSSEPTAKGTGLAQSAGKEDPVELDSSPTL